MTSLNFNVFSQVVPLDNKCGELSLSTSVTVKFPELDGDVSIANKCGSQIYGV